MFKDKAFPLVKPSKKKFSFKQERDREKLLWKQREALKALRSINPKV